jgi:hypothetical protein
VANIKRGPNGGIRPTGDTSPVRIKGPAAGGQPLGGNPSNRGGVNRPAKGR